MAFSLSQVRFSKFRIVRDGLPEIVDVVGLSGGQDIVVNCFYFRTGIPYSISPKVDMEPLRKNLTAPQRMLAGICGSGMERRSQCPVINLISCSNGQRPADQLERLLNRYNTHVSGGPLRFHFRLCPFRFFLACSLSFLSAPCLRANHSRRPFALACHRLRSRSAPWELPSTFYRRRNSTRSTARPILKESLSAGWGPITYRQNTELTIDAWHWNPNGHWSDPETKSGYFIGDAEPSGSIDKSFGYRLPHRGSTRSDEDTERVFPHHRWRPRELLEEQSVPDREIYRRAGQPASAVGGHRLFHSPGYQRHPDSMGESLCHTNMSSNIGSEKKMPSPSQSPESGVNVSLRARVKMAMAKVSCSGSPIIPISDAIPAYLDDALFQYLRHSRQTGPAKLRWATPLRKFMREISIRSGNLST